VSNAKHAPFNYQPPNWLLLALLSSPWLCSYASGPTPTVWPWLFSAFCATTLWIFRRNLTVKLVATAWVLAASISAFFGLLQYFGLSHAFGPWIRDAYPGEAFANLRQRNHFATLTSIGLLGLIGLVALPDRLSEKSETLKLPGWTGAASLLIALGNAASNSRTGLLQWLLVLILVAWWGYPHPYRRCIVRFAAKAVIFYVAGVFALPWLLTNLTGFATGGLFGRLGEAPTCQSRAILWSNVLTLISQKPWLGWGWGELAYPHFITPYPGARFCGILDNAHNLPMHLAVELGIPAALVILTSLGWMVWQAKPWNESDTRRQMAWSVLAVIMLHSLLEYPLWYGSFQMAVGLCIGILFAISKRRPGMKSVLGQTTSEKSSQNSYGVSAGTALVNITIFATLLTIGFEYDRVSNIYLLSPKESIAFHHGAQENSNRLSLFKNQVNFAKLGVTELAPANAIAINSLASSLLHYSPEPFVIEKVIESAIMLGKPDEAMVYLARYRDAFPEDHLRWAKEHPMLLARMR
jgi:O-antigen ligase